VELLTRITAQFKSVQALVAGRELVLGWDSAIGEQPQVSSAAELLTWLQQRAAPVKAKIAECEAAIEALPEVIAAKAREKSFQETIRQREARVAEEQAKIASMSL
jgi:hypothetical protein